MQASPQINQLRVDLSQTMTEIHAKGWASGTGGNFSVVTQRNPLQLLMAPSGVEKGKVQPIDLIEVDRLGAVIAGTGKASAETLLHLEIVNLTGAGSVLHTHSVFNTVLSEYYLSKRGETAIALSNYEMLKGLEGITTHDTTVNLSILPNDQDLKALSQAFRVLREAQSAAWLDAIFDIPPDKLSDELPGLTCLAPGILIAGHGLYTWGKDLFTARRHLEILEFLMEVTYRKLILWQP
jgi:methylthioribulose-1-phosphate dehydratase